mgnify:CR=1 FL=1
MRLLNASALRLLSATAAEGRLRPHLHLVSYSEKEGVTYLLNTRPEGAGRRSANSPDSVTLWVVQEGQDDDS